MLTLGGCTPLPKGTGNAAAVPNAASAAVNRQIGDILRSHGERQVVTDGDGIGVAGNPARFNASLYSSKQNESGFVVENEFRIKLTPDREITEYVVGIGSTERKAMDDATVNFALTTFHPVYRMFFNPSDPHQAVDKVKMSDGKLREVAFGDLYARSAVDLGGALGPMRPRLKALIPQLRLDDGPHWIKIVYGQNRSAPVTVAVTMDNQDSLELTETVKNLPWPKREKYYLVKQFVVIK